MNDFDRHISLIRALKRLQPNHKKIYSIFTDITPADVYFFMTIYHTINGSEFHSFSEMKPVSVSELRENVQCFSRCSWQTGYRFDFLITCY